MKGVSIEVCLMPESVREAHLVDYELNQFGLSEGLPFESFES